MGTLAPRRDFVAPARDLVIDGRRVAGQGVAIEVHNPATEQVLGSVRGATPEQAAAAVEAAVRGFEVWSRMSRLERSEILSRWADLIEEHVDDLVTDAINTIGAPISYAEAIQVRIGLGVLRWAAEAARIDRTEDLGPWHDPWLSISQIRYQPVGPVACLVAYNAPNNMALFKAGPALAAGCSVVLMPSPRAPMSPLWLAEMAQEAGMPPGTLNAIVGDIDASKVLTSHPDIQKVSFTGSVSVGSEIMGQAARGLKDVVLELGGKSPMLLLEGTDLEAVAAQIHLRWARMAGQGCAAPSRILVPDRMYDQFVDVTRHALSEMVVGDPWDPATMVGPLIRPDHCDRVHRYVDEVGDVGGHVIAQAPPPRTDTGWYMRPTVLGGLDNDSRAAREEIFGPVSVALPCKGLDEMIDIANDTTLGLTAHVYGPDLAEALALVDRLRAGTVWINGGGAMRPDAPFGGFKQSGIGREFGELGLREFLEPQHVQFRV